MSQPPAEREPEAFPDDEEKGPKESTSRISISSQWSAPLPPPEVLARFDRIVPGSAEKIINQMFKEADHRHGMEKASLDLEHESVREQFSIIQRGQRFGFIIGLVGIGGGLVAAGMGIDAAGIAGILGGVAILVGAMLTGRSKSPGTTSDPNPEDSAS